MTEETDAVRMVDAENTAFWNRWAFACVPVHAQTAEVMYYGDPTEEIYALPEILTW